MRRKILGVVFAVAMMLSMLGCESGGKANRTSETNTQEAKKDTKSKNASDIVVCYAIKGQNAWLEQEGIGCKEACEELGLPAPTVVYADSQQNAESQVKSIEDFMSLGADVIIIDPISATVVRQSLQNAKDQGVIVIDTDTVGEMYDLMYASIGLDEYSAAYGGAEEFCKYLEKGDGVVIITGEQGDSNAENRLKGMTEACEAKGMKILAHQYTDWTAAKTTNAMEDFITNFEDELKGVLVVSDDMAMGAITALEQANKIEAVKMMGYGGYQVAIDAIRDGKMSVTVGMHPYMCGSEAVKVAYDILVNGKYPEEQFIDVGIDFITSENYAEFEGF